MIRRILSFRAVARTTTCTARSFHRQLPCYSEQKPNRDDDFESMRKSLEFQMETMRRIQEIAGTKLPLTFGTEMVATRYDRIKMFPFPSFQKRLYVSSFDPQFNEKEFLEGAKQAFQVVRPLVFEQDIESLKPMITDECYEGLTSFYKEMASVEEKTGMSMRIDGEVQSVNKAEILNIQVSEQKDETTGENRIDSIINVKINATEKIAFKRSDDTTMLGWEDFRDKTSLVSFERKGLNGDWRIRAFLQ